MHKKLRIALIDLYKWRKGLKSPETKIYNLIATADDKIRDMIAEVHGYHVTAFRCWYPAKDRAKIIDQIEVELIFKQ